MGKKRSPAQLIARLEGIVIGMGFLLAKIDTSSMGVGMQEQITQALNDWKQLSGNIKAREAEKKNVDNAV